MRVYVHGTGAREHAIIQVIQKDKRVEHIFTNHVIQNTTHIPCPTSNYSNLIYKLKQHKINFVIIGPEQALSDGLVDLLKQNNIPAFGPTKEQAQLETSKYFAKQIMQKLNIPTANYKFFNTALEARDYLDSIIPNSCVIKKDGLAAGKGVVLPTDIKDAKRNIDEFHTNILIEDRLEGQEISVIAFCNGKKAFLMPQVQDYKRTHNGLNTGGMGAHGPVNILTEQEMENINTYLNDVVQDLNYTGFLYAGIMKTVDNIYFLEFNCRLGDPEAQVLLNLLDVSLMNVLMQCYIGSTPHLQWKQGYCTTVVLSHIDYPLSKLPSPTQITGFDKLDNNVITYYSNVDDSKTTGGRIASITNYAKTHMESFLNVYNNINKLELADQKRYYRHDIGLKQLLSHPPKRHIKIAILASTNGNSSRKLIEYAKINDNVSIELIFTDRSHAGIINLAKQNNIPYICRPKKKSETREEYDAFVCNLLKLYEVDYVFLIGYMKIITNVLLNNFHNRVFNIHPSLLPRFAGGMDMSVHEQVLKAREYTTGCTLHLVSEQVDAGKIILQKSLVINTEIPLELKCQVQNLEAESIVECVKLLINGSLDDKITYESSGVSIKRGESIVASLSKAVQNIGGFCSVRNNLGMTTDGVGTKIELCQKYNKLYNAGIDLVAMSVNDLLCSGVLPEYFLDYIATDRIGNNVDEFLRGVLEGCRQAGCELVGGETAEMKSLYRVNTMDAAGFAIGHVKYDISGDVQNDDLLIGLKSSGLHSNGFSLIREIYKNQVDVDWDRLLEPTKIYVDEIREILENKTIKVKAIVNITGGGFVKNIPRVLKIGQTFKLTHKWERDSIFDEIQNKTNLSYDEILETFNCGIGMVLIVSPDSNVDGFVRLGHIISGFNPRL